MRFAAPKAKKTHQIREEHFHNKSGTETEMNLDGYGQFPSRFIEAYSEATNRGT